MSGGRIVVVGAGLQGATVALELAHLGQHVILLEAADRPMSRASLHNEGKVHLGFVYALDRTGTTRQRMLEGALSFAPVLDRLCGDLPWADWRSEGFRYAVMPGTLASPDELEVAYADLQRRYEELVAASGARTDYVGTTPERLWRRTDCSRGQPVVGGVPAAMYETAEVAVDPRSLGAAITDRLVAHPRIDVRCGVTVASAQRIDRGFRLGVVDAAGSNELDADVVVNCAWADRLRLDRSVGLEHPDQRWLYRRKYSVIVRPSRPADIAPVTMVQGPFGDVVPRPDGAVYVSWYPTARTYLGSEPPDDVGEPDVEAELVARRSLDALTPMFPDLDGAEIVSSSPGLIVAKGRSDVDDPASGLHSRDEFGAEHHDGWWTVNPAKLTTAPLVGSQTARGIASEVGVGVG